MGSLEKRILKKRKKYWSIFLTAFVLVLALIGSYQYFSDPEYVGEVVENRLWSSVLYSALQLYAFSSPVNPGKATPVFYEAAKWMAPLCTGYWLVQILEAFFQRQFCMLRRSFLKREQILVFGYHEKNMAFLQSLTAEKAADRDITLVVGESLDETARIQLERSGILVLEMPVLDCAGTLSNEEFSALHLDRTGELILFEEDQLENLTLFMKIANRLSQTESGTPQKVNGKIYCALWCENRAMQRFIIDYYDECRARNLLELHLFNMPEIAADHLFRDKPVYENCLSWAKKQPEGFPDGDFLKVIPMPHILIIGFGRYGQAVFTRALQTGILSDRSEISGYRRLRITILDSDIRKVHALLDKQYPGLHRICDISCMEGDACDPRAIRELAKLPRITYGVVCLGNQTEGMESAELLRSLLRAERQTHRNFCQLDMEIPIAIRMKENDGMLHYFYHSSNSAGTGPSVTAFGTDRKLFSHDNIVRSGLEEAAVAFNARYQRISARMSGCEQENMTPQEMWNGLSFEKKESSRVQALNAPYFRELLTLLPSLPRFEMLLQDGTEADKFLRQLAKWPFLEKLAALEHERWCAFCYSCGYIGSCDDPMDKGKERWFMDDEKSFGKVHPCLIDDWEEFCKSSYRRSTVIYDVCGIYTYSDLK